MLRFIAIAGFLLGCGPQVGTVDIGDTSADSSGGADGMSASGAGGRPGSGGTSGSACDREQCPRCGPGCEAEVSCEPDGRVVCGCACGGDEVTGSISTSGASEGGDVGSATDGGEGTSDGGEDTVGCVPGREGCACTRDGDCDPGFQCDANRGVCFLDVCPVGTEGCDCTPGDHCDPALSCVEGTCVDLGSPCPAGMEGCPCDDAGECEIDLACEGGVCMAANGG